MKLYNNNIRNGVNIIKLKLRCVRYNLKNKVCLIIFYLVLKCSISML